MSPKAMASSCPQIKGDQQLTVLRFAAPHAGVGSHSPARFRRAVHASTSARTCVNQGQNATMQYLVTTVNAGNSTSRDTSQFGGICSTRESGESGKPGQCDGCRYSHASTE